MGRDQADVRGGARAGGGRVNERRLDERAVLAVETALAWVDVNQVVRVVRYGAVERSVPVCK